MNPAAHCPHCGSKLAMHTLGGLCPGCMGRRLAAANPTAPPPPAHPELLATDESVGLRLSRYKLVEELGEGGCGIVYAAEQEKPIRRRVALKVIKPGLDTPAVIARFEAERRTLAMMAHPNIAKLFDAGATPVGRLFFVMELVPGLRITEYCDQHQLGIRERIELFITVCQAVQHAHQKGVIHLDLKPSNILVAGQDGAPAPKVIDFGIAKATQQARTELTPGMELNEFLGTPSYMSPEQAESRGRNLDARSDIYSLGGLLYELLTGRTPFDAWALVKQGADALRRTLREVAPPQPSGRLTTVASADLDSVARARGTEGEGTSLRVARGARLDRDEVLGERSHPPVRYRHRAGPGPL